MRKDKSKNNFLHITWRSGPFGELELSPANNPRIPGIIKEIRGVYRWSKNNTYLTISGHANNFSVGGDKNKFLTTQEEVEEVIRRLLSKKLIQEKEIKDLYTSNTKETCCVM